MAVDADGYEIVRIPEQPMDAAGESLLGPTAKLLQGLYLLGTPAEMRDAGNAGAAFGGPPQSVAVIEANATALSKWWAGGAGATVLAVWGGVRVWFQNADNTGLLPTVVWGASIVTAALVLAIALIVATDVRSRARAAEATIAARSLVGCEMIRAAAAAHRPAQAADGSAVTPARVLEAVEMHLPDGEWLGLTIARADGGRSTPSGDGS